MYKLMQKKEKLYTALVLCGCFLVAILMYFRCFYGAEITDEAYYVSEAKEMLNGNIPYAVNNSSKALGYTFLLIPIQFIYKLFVPDLEGIFLVTRLCFVTFKLIIACIIYCVLQKEIKKANALLLIGILIPLSGYLQNFSYNTIPMWMLLLTGCLLYDALEQPTKYRNIEILGAGFSAAIACFANPGWALALFVFLILIVVRISNKKEKYKVLMLFFGAVVAEVAIVVVPIIVQTSFSEFWYGFYRLYFHPFPMDSLAPEKSLGEALGSFIEPLKRLVRIFIRTTIVVFFFAQIYLCKKQKKLASKQYLTLAIAVALFADVASSAHLKRGVDLSDIWGFTAVVYFFVFAVLGLGKEEKVIWYLGVYPVLYSIAAIVLVAYDADISRFSNSVTVLIPLLYILLKQQVALTRGVGTLIAVVLILSIGYTDFKYVYRDDPIQSLDYKIESGVYKGIYTSVNRAKDIPELEEYLNGIIGEGETYAFRDNVPSAYLMVHTGKVCEISTWDILQYTYDRNSPAVMFDYYRRRDMIPDKIIYIDYGRDENLSIDDPKYRYNDWVNAYYDLVDDFKLNETYYRVIVYQYNGSFDENYQYWIDTYYNLIK